MSYAWLFGLLVGMLAAVGVVLVGWLAVRNRGEQQPVSDERTQMMKTQAGANSFYLTAGFAGLAWLYEILHAFLTDAEPPVVTPWSIMLAVMLFIHLGATLYQHWRNALWSDLDEQEQAQLRRQGGTLLAGLGATGISARLAFESGANAVGWFMLALAGFGVVVGLFLMAMASKKRAA